MSVRSNHFSTDLHALTFMKALLSGFSPMLAGRGLPDREPIQR